MDIPIAQESKGKLLHIALDVQAFKHYQKQPVHLKEHGNCTHCTSKNTGMMAQKLHVIR